MTELESRLESILFVAGEPVALTALCAGLETDPDTLGKALARLEESYLREGRGLRLLYTDKTAQLTSAPENGEAVEKVLAPIQKRSVSASMLETLAVVAYKQPVTRGEIEEIRGVRCEYAVTQLQKLGLISVSGRKDVPGRPLLFVTTDAFLHKFRLHSAGDARSGGNRQRIIARKGSPGIFSARKAVFCSFPNVFAFTGVFPGRAVWYDTGERSWGMGP